MKRALFLTVCIIVLMVPVPVSSAGTPYAEKVDIPKNVSRDDPQWMSVMTVRAAEVPERSVVGIPPYPGARVFQTRKAGSMEANGKKYKTLPYIKLLSTDPPEKVTAWYRKRLKGYSSEDVFGTGWIFWKGKGKFDSLDIRDTMTRQNVYVSKAIAAMGYDKDMKGTKTVIEITYEPRK